jgi:hypothetical protein
MLLAPKVPHLENRVFVKELRARRIEVEVQVVGAMGDTRVEVGNSRVFERELARDANCILGCSDR